MMVAVTLGATTLVALTSQAVTYDFEGLSFGSLTNQDNWKVIAMDPR